jgi:isoquinoline 1-oxidoreductase beta subunit
MTARKGITRRRFITTSAMAGGGLLLACHLPFGRCNALATEDPEFSPNAWLRISTSGRITVIINKSEMGQGICTSLPMLVAEELCCDWRSVVFRGAPVAPEYNHTQFGPLMMTGGSTSVRSEWERLSLAGAAAREMLIAAAAKEWGVSIDLCRTENGAVFGPKGRKLGFGALASKAALLPVPRNPKLKGGANTILGKPLHRLDSPAKINGTAEFGIDVTAPGMLTAVIARPPVFGGTVRHFDPRRALSIPGVTHVVAVDAGVAVVATTMHHALQGREALSVTWDERAGSALDTAVMRSQYAGMALTPGRTARRDGDAPSLLANASRRFEADYELPYLAHAPMEPLNCFVDLRADSCLIRTGSQSQTLDRAAAAREAGLRPEQVTLETTFLGGGFGRRACPASDFIIEAVQVAKAVRRPVKVIRTRDDDMRAGYYRPMWHSRIEACLDEQGMPRAWLHRIVGQSIAAGTPMESSMVKDGIDHASVEGGADMPYSIPNLQVELHSPTGPVPVLWWRSVGHSHTAFVVESMLDELAAAAGKDPLAYRTALLRKRQRTLNVLETAAAKAGWGAPLPHGRGRGIAVHESFGSYVAQVAEVSVDTRGKLKVHRVVCAVDCGRIVNPDTIVAQMESGIVFGLSAALFGAITLKNGRVEQGNFDSYPLVRMNDMPTIEVHIIPSDEPPGGVGEPGVPPVAPAVANALFSLSGIRIRSLPLSPESVLAAINAKK